MAESVRNELPFPEESQTEDQRVKNRATYHFVDSHFYYCFRHGNLTYPFVGMTCLLSLYR
jgi:hypothetical protein